MVSENLGVDVPSSYVTASALMLGLAIHDLPVLRVHLGRDPEAGLLALEAALAEALG